MQNTSYNSTVCIAKLSFVGVFCQKLCKIQVIIVLYVTQSQVLQVHFVKKVSKSGGYKEMSSIFAAQYRPRNMSPNAGGGGELRGLRQ